MGVLILIYFIDFEGLRYYMIKVLVEDGGFLFLNIIVIFRIIVVDVNDYILVFFNLFYFVCVDEFILVGIDILNVIVIDVDIGNNVWILYSF